MSSQITLHSTWLSRTVPASSVFSVVSKESYFSASVNPSSATSSASNSSRHSAQSSRCARTSSKDSSKDLFSSFCSINSARRLSHLPQSISLSRVSKRVSRRILQLFLESFTVYYLDRRDSKSALEYPISSRSFLSRFLASCTSL